MMKQTDVEIPQMPEPKDGQHYDVYIGDSFKRGGTPHLFHTLRFNFKPTSVQNFTGVGSIAVDDKSHVAVTMPCKDNENGMLFSGQMSDCQGVECLLIFDGKSFRIERLTSNIRNLKNSRSGAVKPIKRQKTNHYPILAPPTSSLLSSSAPSSTTIANSSLVERECERCCMTGSGLFECHLCHHCYHQTCAMEPSPPSPSQLWFCPACKTKQMEQQNATAAGQNSRGHKRPLSSDPHPSHQLGSSSSSTNSTVGGYPPHMSMASSSSSAGRHPVVAGHHGRTSGLATSQQEPQTYPQSLHGASASYGQELSESESESDSDEFSDDHSDKELEVFL